MSFSGDIEAFARKSGESLDKTVRSVTIELGTAIIKGTPVDEGRAKGNWQTSTGAPKTGELDRTGDSASISELQQNAGGAGTVTYIANNLPYIYRLEFGWSKKQSAPYAMVRGNFTRIESMINAAVQKNKV